MAFDLPKNLVSSDGGLFVGLSRWSYNVTNGLFFVALLLGFCMVLFIAAARFGTARAFGFASMAGLFGAMFLATLGLMSWWIASLFILVGVTGLAVMVLNSR